MLKLTILNLFYSNGTGLYAMDILHSLTHYLTHADFYRAPLHNHFSRSLFPPGTFTTIPVLYWPPLVKLSRESAFTRWNVCGSVRKLHRHERSPR